MSEAFRRSGGLSEDSRKDRGGMSRKAPQGLAENCRGVSYNDHEGLLEGCRRAPGGHLQVTTRGLVAALPESSPEIPENSRSLPKGSQRYMRGKTEGFPRGPVGKPQSSRTHPAGIPEGSCELSEA